MPPKLSRRRLWLALLAPASARAGGAARAVTDAEELNAFALDYNRYVEGLRSGIVDLKQWERVARCWNRMTRE